MKHIVQVLTDTNIGGAGRYLLNYLDCFDRSRYRVTVILPEGSKLSGFVKSFPDVTLLEAPFMADQSYHKKCVSYLKAQFSELKPDILHTHACLSARIAGRLAKVPVILATRHCIEPLPHGAKALVSGILNNALCDYYIAVSKAVKENLLDSGIKRSKIKQVNNGVQTVKELPKETCAEIRARYQIDENDVVFGVFARLEPVKGHKYFIKAARQVVKEIPDAKFLIVGNGSLELELKNFATHYGLDKNIIFTGFVSDTAELLNITDVNVITSESEAMSLALLEAMSIGKPSIATKVGGNKELITNGEDGILVSYADSASLALAMMRMICNKTLRAQMGENAKRKFAEAFTVDKMVARLENVYQEVLSHD